MPNPTVFDAQGARVPLAGKLWEGGEGVIYEVAVVGNLVAKLYPAPLSAEKVAKLQAMAACRTERLLAITAWPVGTLHAAPGGAVQGFLMPRGRGCDIHLLYSPKSRFVSFPNTTWPFLLRTAANLARAFAVVHEHGHVVGDGNQGNSLVSDRATVTLIDCDSFQIAAGGRVFPCGVGTELFLAPELQGLSLGRVLRTVDHDSFSLAVLAFHLLFLGRHPFAGRYLGAGEMPIERAIRECRFAYGSAARTFQMEPPPNTLSMRAVSQEIQELFERAFSTSAAAGAHRPAPELWVDALEALSRQLAVCAQNSAHHYYRELSRCPWCEIEEGVGIALFAIFVLPGPAPLAVAFEIHAVWAQIAAVQPPPRMPPPDPAAIRCRPSALGRREGWKRLAQLFVAAAALAAGYVLTRWLGWFLGFLVSVTAATKIIEKRWGGGFSALKTEEAGARQQWLQAEGAWRSEASDELFDAARRRLEEEWREYQDLPAARLRQLDELRTNLRGSQLRRFLDHHRIDRGNIAGIGVGRVATLRSYGIETAADVTPAALAHTPGFGPMLTGRLLDWRRSIEKQFVFDATRGVDPADVADLERRLETRRRELEKDLRGGAAALRQLGARVLLRRRALLPRMNGSARRLAQAEADLRFARYWRVR
jgi:DNA-binding helix-hairpin-helix protein with protein kinase domain